MSLFRGIRKPLLQIGVFRPSDIPRHEAKELVKLYRLTNGKNWSNNSGWLNDRVVNNWFGITVLNGHVTEIILTNNNLSGNVQRLNLLAFQMLEELRLNANNISGNIKNWRYPDSLDYIRINNCFLSGDWSKINIPPSMLNYFVSTNLGSGDISSWIITPGMANFQIYSNAFSGSPDISSNTAIRTYRYEDCGLSQSDVDAVIDSIYQRRAAFTYATPSMNISGTNSTPSGIYQNATPPTTGKEKIFKLVNDPDGEGFNVWTITYTP